MRIYNPIGSLCSLYCAWSIYNDPCTYWWMGASFAVAIAISGFVGFVCDLKARKESA